MESHLWYFADFRHQASREMGVRLQADSFDEGGKTFSDDIFKVEIHGPQEINLSVIDIPGLFRARTERITTDEDMVFVENMVRGYIQNQKNHHPSCACFQHGYRHAVYPQDGRRSRS